MVEPSTDVTTAENSLQNEMDAANNFLIFQSITKSKSDRIVQDLQFKGKNFEDFIKDPKLLYNLSQLNMSRPSIIQVVALKATLNKDTEKHFVF